MLGASTMYSDPNYQINAEGPLGIDPTHLLKISGAVDIPVVDVTLGMYYSFRTGSPYSSGMALPRDMVTFRGDSVYIYGEERGSYRYKEIHNLDLRLEKFFRIGEFRVGALVDVFNVFNSSTVTDYETQMDQWSDYQFGYIWGIRGPRTFRLGFRFEF
jgi:outer membrane receptor protein involved in Fe transport